jgi:hypothetical protein
MMNVSVEVKLPAQAVVAGVGRLGLTILSLSGTGMCVASDCILQPDWTVKIDLIVPGADRSERLLITVATRALPEIREAHGQYVQDLVLIDPSAAIQEEIDRLIAELRARGS